MRDSKMAEDEPLKFFYNAITLKNLDASITVGVACVSFHPTRPSIFIGYRSGDVAELNLETGKEAQRVSLHHEIVTLHALEKSLLVFDRQGVISHLNLPSFDIQHQIKVSRKNLSDEKREWTHGVFSSSGKTLVAVDCGGGFAADDSDVLHVDTTSGEWFPYWTKSVDAYLITDLSLTRDEKFLATTGISYTVSMDWDRIGLCEYVHLWNVGEAEPFQYDALTDLLDIGEIQSLSFNPSGELLLTCSGTWNQITLIRNRDILNWYVFDTYVCLVDRSKLLQYEHITTFAPLGSEHLLALGTSQGRLIFGKVPELSALETYDETHLEEHFRGREITKKMEILHIENVSTQPLSKIVLSPTHTHFAALDEKDHLVLGHIQLPDLEHQESE